MSLPLDDEAFAAFLVEAREHLVSLEQNLLALEGQGASADPESINTIFRAAHTIKGTAGFFGLEPVKGLAHAAEDVLGRVRSMELEPTADVTSTLLKATDLLGQMIANTAQVVNVDSKDVVQRLRDLAVPPGPPSTLGSSRTAVAVPVAQPAVPPVQLLNANRTSVPSLGTLPPAARAPVGPVPLVPDFDVGRKLEVASTIRVNLGQLDRLMMLAGELVLTRNALLKKASERDIDEMINLSQRVDAITSELQDGIMATRMQPVGLVFTKFRRVVRDLAQNLGKKLLIEIEGEDVELDRTLIEALTGSVDPPRSQRGGPRD